ncbi:MAG: glycine cleavage system protein H [Candidatus Altiarchaeales archaeon WOR_SM1_86-2]|nr:MAG: glycine cleavage system protein H [Candidatus Altiarchaeales archaeon WOR_SM1_86-2]ODS38039.1 MAG: glycine cleavage system protein H [Candidatus Altiarchaeales archaeon WOR_SM1_79]
MDMEGYDMPDELYYHKGHMWARVEGNKARVGVNDFTQKLAGEVSYADAPFEGDEVKQDDEVGTIETGKWVGKLYAPVSGKVSAVNEALEDDPTLINRDPYGEGWIFEVDMSDPGELNNLMQGDKAAEWLRGEIKEHA